MRGIICVLGYMCVCEQNNERLTHLFMRIFLLALFPDLHFVAIFCSSEFMCRGLFFIFLWALKLHLNSPSPHIFVTHDEKNQAKCNKSSKEQNETRRSVEHGTPALMALG